MTTQHKKTVKPGSKLKAAIKASPKKRAPKKHNTVVIPRLLPFKPLTPLKQSKVKDHPLQWQGSYMKEDTVNREALKQFYGMDHRPQQWFELHIGQLIYAISEKGFIGWIEVANKQHAESLCHLQGGDYTFSNVLRMSERLAGIEQLTPSSSPNTMPMTDEEYQIIWNKTFEIGYKLQDLEITNPSDLDDYEYKLHREFAYELNREFTKLHNITTDKENDPQEIRSAFAEILKYENIEEVERILVEKVQGLHGQVLNAIDAHLQESYYEEPYTGTFHQVARLLIGEGKYNRAEDFSKLLEEIKRYLLNPDVSTHFINSTDLDYNHFTNLFESLESFFENMADEAEEIEITRLSISTYPRRFDFKALKTNLVNFQDKIKIARYEKDLWDARNGG